MSKVYFKTGNVDTLINVTMKVKTETREGSNAHHVVFTNEAMQLAEHRTDVQSATFLIKEFTDEGYDTNKFIQLHLSAESILSLAEKIKSMQGAVVIIKYGGQEDDDLPF